MVMIALKWVGFLTVITITLTWTTKTRGQAQTQAFVNNTATPLVGTTPAQWRIVWTTDPAHRATISWSTAEPGSDQIVYYDTQPRNGDLDAYTFHQDAQRNGQYSLSSRDQTTFRERPPVAPAWYHHARITDLKPDTTYYFTLVSDGQASPELQFRTAPVDNTPFSIIYGGDSRTGYQARLAVNLMMAALSHRGDRVLAFIHGGDYIVDGHQWRDWTRWLSDHEAATTKLGRVLPIIPTRGNHDSGPLFNEIFDFPEDDLNYYVTRIGSEFALVTLNSNIPAAGAQRSWLADQLAQLRPQVRWLTVQYHRPVYPAVKTPGAGLMAWVPIFEQYDVDLACESDGHVIKRTVPIRRGHHDPTGVVYIGEGGLGVPQRTPDVTRWYLKPPGMASKGHHLHLLDITDHSLRIRLIRLSGKVADDYRLKPRQLVAPIDRTTSRTR